MTLNGKGFFIWQIPRCEGGVPSAIAERAAAAGLSHVLIKIAERTFGFGFDRSGQDLAAPVAEALRDRGIEVWGWHYIYGDKPADEAATAIRRVTELGLDGYVVDAEKEFKHSGMSAAARTFMSAVRAGLPGTPIALSSYRYPSLHPQVPWSIFLEKCDLVMPQVYWEQAHNADQQLARSVAEFGKTSLVGHARPLIPTGAAYGVPNPAWRAAPEDIQKFLAKARELGLTAANFYSWDYAGAPGNRDLWQAAADFEWPRPQPADVVTRLFAALNAGDLNQVLRLYQPNAGHVTARRTVVGQADLRQWYQDLLQDLLAGGRFEVVQADGDGSSRRFRWTAAGPGGSVADGDDTLGLRDGLIQYHFTSFTFVPKD